MAWKPKTSETSIGIVGPSWSGKTVFLTSLINHLQHHEPSQFSFGKKGTGIRRFTELDPKESWPRFPYAEFRNRIVNRLWPSKSTDRSVYSCRFERTDWNFTDSVMHFYDLPGERINDVAMLNRETSEYATWSDSVLKRLRDDVEYQTAFEGFFKETQAESIDENRLLQQYRLGLARLWLAFKPYLTPSTFLLDLNGKPCRGKDPELIASDRYSGLGAQEQFVPLPAEVRAKQIGLREQFTVRFNRYRDQVVVPWVGALKSCHGLVVMVDVLEILAAGHQMYGDVHQLLRDLFSTLRLNNHPLKQLGDAISTMFLPHFIRPAWVKRVAFVAPKADRAHPRDRMNFGRLLTEMNRKFIEDLEADGINCKSFRVASVVSTEEHRTVGEERQLRGSTLYDAQGNRLPPGEKQVFSVSRVPESWPRDWREGEFNYPEVYPDIPPLLTAVPQQEGLAELFDFLCW
jgi:predicted YcjX-like family ATPase